MDRVRFLQRVREAVASMLPNPDVVGEDEDSHKAAVELVAFWEAEAKKGGRSLCDDVDADDLDEFREVVIMKVAELIENARVKDEQIAALCTEACAAGDTKMVALCDVVLLGEPRDFLTGSDRSYAAKHTYAEARAKCARAIRNARA